MDGTIYDGEREINYNSIWVLKWSTREEGVLPERVEEGRNGPVTPRLAAANPNALFLLLEVRDCQ